MRRNRNIKFNKLTLGSGVRTFLTSKKHYIHGYADTLVREMKPNIVYFYKIGKNNVPVFVHAGEIYTINYPKKDKNDAIKHLNSFTKDGIDVITSIEAYNAMLEL